VCDVSAGLETTRLSAAVALLPDVRVVAISLANKGATPILT